MESPACSKLLVEHNLFGKMVSIFPDHALAFRKGRRFRPCEKPNGVLSMRVIIAGGGIGGLAAGLMLHARGIACDVFEQGSEIRELGVGINTLPHAIKELAEIGLLERLDHVGIRTHELTYANRFGQEID